MAYGYQSKGKSEVETDETTTGASGVGVSVVDEDPGQVGPDPHKEVGDLDAHGEVSNAGAEAVEEYAEATPEQMAAESVEESAFSDLKGIVGFEGIEESMAAEAAPLSLLPDAGAATDAGQQEFLPILAKIAPMLLSTVGPPLARAVVRKLSPKAQRALKSRRFRGTLAVAAKFLQGALQQPATGESEMEVDGALVEEVASQMEVIIGNDDRGQITRTDQLPWRLICALRIHMASGAMYRGTGFFIGPRAVATAGHCVYLHNQGGWARRIEVFPGSNGAQTPFGSAPSSSFRSVNGWTKDKKPECDYGSIVLGPGAFAGRALGNFGFASFPTPILLAKPAVVAGYPGDKPFAELWGMGRRIKAATSQRLVYEHDTVGGQSGAPVYVNHRGKRYVAGIHNYGASTGNSATRVIEPVFQNLSKWSKLGR
jgi:V8-like Glu-specific endopeptidase